MLLAFARPHPPLEGKERSSLRMVWEAVHMTMGPIVTFMGAANVFTGLVMVNAPKYAYGLVSITIAANCFAWVSVNYRAATTGLLPKEVKAIGLELDPHDAT